MAAVELGDICDGTSVEVSGSTLRRAAVAGDVTIAAGGATATVNGAALSDDGNSGTTKTIDWQSYKFGRHRLTLTGNVTLTLSNPADGGVYYLLIYTGAGSFTVTWPASVKWPGGTGPTITATASKVDLVRLVWDATAGKYYGTFNQNY